MALVIELGAYQIRFGWAGEPAPRGTELSWIVVRERIRTGRNPAGSSGVTSAEEEGDLIAGVGLASAIHAEGQGGGKGALVVTCLLDCLRVADRREATVIAVVKLVTQRCRAPRNLEGCSVAFVVSDDLAFSEDVRNSMIAAALRVGAVRASVVPCSLAVLIQSGRASGLVVDVGHAGVRAVAVTEGTPLVSTLEHTDVGVEACARSVARRVASQSSLNREIPTGVPAVDESVVSGSLLPYAWTLPASLFPKQVPSSSSEQWWCDQLSHELFRAVAVASYTMTSLAASDGEQSALFTCFNGQRVTVPSEVASTAFSLLVDPSAHGVADVVAKCHKRIDPLLAGSLPLIVSGSALGAPGLSDALHKSFGDRVSSQHFRSEPVFVRQEHAAWSGAALLADAPGFFSVTR